MTENVLPEEAETKRGFWSEVLSNVPALLFGLFIAFICLEIIVRVFFPQEARLYQADRYIRTIHRPNVETTRVREEFTAKVRTNDQGFAGDDFVVEKEPNTTRIAMLGDSFTEGFWVDEEASYAHLLPEYLEASTTKDYEVYNFGVSGHGTSLNYLTYKHYASTYNPDWVVMQFYVRNDYTNDLMNRNRPEFSVEENSTSFYGTFREFLYNNFQSPRFVIRKIKKIYAVNELLADLNIITRQHDPNVSGYPVYFEPFNTKNTEVYDEVFEYTCGIVADLKAEVEENGGKLAAFVIPAKEQFYETDWQQYTDQYPNMNEQEWNLRRPVDAITSCFFEHGVPHIDLSDQLNSHIAAQGERPFYVTDDHFNEVGNRLAAEEIAKFMAELTAQD